MLVFIDEWPEEGRVYLHQDNINSTPVWEWNYSVEGSYGEQLCGTNKMDYVLHLTA